MTPSTTTPTFACRMRTTTPKTLDTPSSTTIAVYIYRRPKTRVPRAPSSSTERVRLQWCTTTDAVYDYFPRRPVNVYFHYRRENDYLHYGREQLLPLRHVNDYFPRRL